MNSHQIVICDTMSFDILQQMNVMFARRYFISDFLYSIHNNVRIRLIQACLCTTQRNQETPTIKIFLCPLQVMVAEFTSTQQQFD